MGFSEDTSLGNQTPTPAGLRKTFANTGGVKGRGTGTSRAEHGAMYGAGMPGARTPQNPTAGFPGRGGPGGPYGPGGATPSHKVPTPGPAVDPYGSESGNTYVEDRYLNRLYGEDPAFNYAMKRGGDELDTRMAAGGSFNSGARGQQMSDLYANILAQSQGQLDALAGGASAARQGRLNSMFGQGLGLANGQAGLATAYDLGAAGNMQAANQAQQQMFLNKAGVDSQFNQGRANNIINAYAAYQSGGSK